MANDIKLNWDADLMSGDLGWGDGDLEREAGLKTAVLVSLFSDRRADDDDVLDNINDKRGWWGDQTANISLDQIGSRLWLLDRSKTDQDTLLRAQEYAEESLEWMIDDEVAERIECTTERQTRTATNGNITETLAMKVEIYKIAGNTETFKFDDIWNAQLS